MNKSPTVLYHPLDIVQAREVQQKTGFEQYPIIDELKKICGLFTAEELLQKRINTPVILMAGGVGSRLAPLTDNCPKPLLRIGDRPVLETILIELSNAGFNHIWISVNYRSDMIEDYFGDGKRWNVYIQYLREKEPLGTAGSLKLLTQKYNEPIIVMNGDLLTKLNYHQLLSFHCYHKAQITVGVHEYDFQIPYGVMDLEDIHVINLHEKPVQKYFVNAGIYVLEPQIIQRIPNKFYNMTELLNQIMIDRKVIAFPVHEYWVDVGQYEDFQKANSDYSKIFLSVN